MSVAKSIRGRGLCSSTAVDIDRFVVPTHGMRHETEWSGCDLSRQQPVPRSSRQSFRPPMMSRMVHGRTSQVIRVVNHTPGRSRSSVPRHLPIASVHRARRGAPPPRTAGRPGIVFRRRDRRYQDFATVGGLKRASPGRRVYCGRRSGLCITLAGSLPVAMFEQVTDGAAHRDHPIERRFVGGCRGGT